MECACSASRAVLRVIFAVRSTYVKKVLDALIWTRAECIVHKEEQWLRVCQFQSLAQESLDLCRAQCMSWGSQQDAFHGEGTGEERRGKNTRERAHLTAKKLSSPFTRNLFFFIMGAPPTAWKCTRTAQCKNVTRQAEQTSKSESLERGSQATHAAAGNLS